ncbi:MAG TPA: glycosyltransferase family 2 protein [Thermoanaerobaculia bacterium]|nr:glycosyltransferase family 2 protein [Thermoanaerobaculia bacterium]
MRWMQRGLVTTIIPAYNRAALLREAVASVHAQTYRPIEIIVVDDGSTERWDVDATVIRIENSGPGAAREAGRQRANGEFIQYLDSDDRLLPQRFEKLVAALRDDPDAGVAYGMTRYVDANGAEMPPSWKDPNQRQRTMFPSMLRERWWDTPSPLYRRSVTDAAGPWTTLRREEDWEYDARIAALGTKLVFVPEVLVEVRMHADSLTRGEAQLRDRARAHALIYEHARRFGIGDDAPEMQHFARELFLLARQCGAAGLANESRTLFALAREASGTGGARLQFRLYALLARIAGWSTMGKASAALDRLRGHRSSRW